jgi:hypothetical protein
MTRDRSFELSSAMHDILRRLAADPETDPGKLGKKAVDQLYVDFPDLTPEELDAVSYAFNPDPAAH